MHFARPGVLALALIALARTAPAQQAMAMDAKKDMKEMSHETVTYTVTLHGRWTAANFPVEYPAGAHFSGLIGATHVAGWHLYNEGAMPTAGLERLSEMGRHQPLDAEIRSVITSGRAGALIESGPLKDFGDSVVTTVTIDARFPFISLVAMIAPSPDWFAGVADIDLRDMGGWAATKTVELMAYDSGGDEGTTYLAADIDNSPKHATMRASARHFAVGGKPMPVATITFVRK